MAEKMKPASRIEPEPARISYWFGPGWAQFGRFLSNMWLQIGDEVRICYAHYLKHSIFSFIGLFWFVTSLAAAIFGGLFTALISVILIIFLSIFYVFFYLGFSIVWLMDRAYLHHNRIFTACPVCKARSVIPYYKCPKCGKMHKNLVPGKYGVFHRTCECGEVLGSMFLTGRKNLQAYCPSCGAPLSDREDVPICIPIVGGRSVGKTAFITAFSRKFLTETAPTHDWTTEFYNREKEDIYDDICSDYDHGTTRMTKSPEDLNVVSSVSFSFFLQGKKLKPERLVHIYDIAGEVFTQNTETEAQKQYEYCQGLVLLLDPFSIPMVRNAYESDLSTVDRSGIGTTDIESIVDSFLNKLREVTGLSDKQMYDTPVAIVISKIDSAGLDMELGKGAIESFMKTSKIEGVNELDVEDYLCRDFLKRYDMENFLTEVNVRFRTNRYFACSAIGHERDRGSFEPQGVMEPMEWLFGLADHEISREWHDHDFGKVPITLTGSKKR